MKKINVFKTILFSLTLFLFSSLFYINRLEARPFFRRLNPRRITPTYDLRYLYGSCFLVFPFILNKKMEVIVDDNNKLLIVSKDSDIFYKQFEMFITSYCFQNTNN